MVTGSGSWRVGSDLGGQRASLHRDDQSQEQAVHQMLTHLIQTILSIVSNGHRWCDNVIKVNVVEVVVVKHVSCCG